MQTFQSVLFLIQPNCFMATIDLKDAYYSVKIDELITKYLLFLLSSRLLKFLFYQMVYLLGQENLLN